MKHLIFILVFFISACTSTQTHINHNEIYSFPDQEKTTSSTVDETKAENRGIGENKCQIYLPPSLLISPKSPIEELEQLEMDYKKNKYTATSYHRKKDDILVSHIEKLRAYIRYIVSENNKTYVEYVAKCSGR